MEVIGVRAVLISGAVKMYPTGRAIETDGFMDYRILDENGSLVATRRRSTVDEIELIYSEA